MAKEHGVGENLTEEQVRLPRSCPALLCPLLVSPARRVWRHECLDSVGQFLQDLAKQQGLQLLVQVVDIRHHSPGARTAASLISQQHATEALH